MKKNQKFIRSTLFLLFFFVANSSKVIRSSVSDFENEKMVALEKDDSSDGISTSPNDPGSLREESSNEDWQTALKQDLEPQFSFYPSKKIEEEVKSLQDAAMRGELYQESFRRSFSDLHDPEVIVAELQQVLEELKERFEPARFWGIRSEDMTDDLRDEAYQKYGERFRALFAFLKNHTFSPIRRSVVRLLSFPLIQEYNQIAREISWEEEDDDSDELNPQIIFKRWIGQENNDDLSTDEQFVAWNE